MFWGRWSNLMNIFFRWVETTNPLRCTADDDDDDGYYYYDDNDDVDNDDVDNDFYAGEGHVVLSLSHPSFLHCRSDEDLLEALPLMKKLKVELSDLWWNGWGSWRKLTVDGEKDVF